MFFMIQYICEKIIINKKGNCKYGYESKNIFKWGLEFKI